MCEILPMVLTALCVISAGTAGFLLGRSHESGNEKRLRSELRRERRMCGCWLNELLRAENDLRQTAEAVVNLTLENRIRELEEEFYVNEKP